MLKYNLKNIIHVLILITYAIANSLNAQSTKISIDSENVFQIMEGFGASDAWRCQFVGKYWPVEKKERIAELLFSTEFDGHATQSTGLSIWRFYNGAGTMEQGGHSGIKND
ncbi:O-glycosyl hydrolase family 30 [Seonamhaeicola aphaedonensis]|uniref:O-glycosyl hydrolase family 30 n=1 Tax=Seonamhaeicola aphaedonensis TaxID=1461338 RepID=A0A3D9HLG1_9FLAO|nr:O-glycosyl hydrolase family 30 [Seonamhaeicola aphaedonensis]